MTGDRSWLHEQPDPANSPTTVDADERRHERRRAQALDLTHPLDCRCHPCLIDQWDGEPLRPPADLT